MFITEGTTRFGTTYRSAEKTASGAAVAGRPRLRSAVRHRRGVQFAILQRAGSRGDGSGNRCEAEKTIFPGPGDERDCEISPGVAVRFCWIPPGKATLGSPASESGRDNDEGEHDYSSAGFWLMKYEATQKEWAAVMRGTDIADPSYFKGDKLPVERVSWDDVQRFIVRCDVPKGWKITLPHEDEWEYAYRGGLGNRRCFYWGGELNGDKANSDGALPHGTKLTGNYVSKTTPVGSYETAAPHPWGLCDLSGNVREWCRNDHSVDRKYVRGGSYNDKSSACRAAFRNYNFKSSRFNSSGFRLVLAAD